MKTFLPFLAIALMGANIPETGDNKAASSGTPEPRQKLETPVFDPSAGDACEDDPVLVEGTEDAAELYRDPARPDTLEPMHAVDYEVEGCSLLVMTDGTLVRPPEENANVRRLPAQ
ncbi:hypothetical protein [Aurantiacibacter poecillastricola]|uniref:hypothetical protein n=1 Tax=Aurantiacibacter poecillastricola TaxID=3064385 RepID=UPI00273E7D0F|nr:hypothetical protein [Aurantiacibacter sp. 219JJ12-13]MDP5262038.1 hypothetical protein [Aurantiacibacter sp. 219JJ12-13]